MTETPAIVFIVDDDASVREALGRLVRSAGLKVEAFASAEAFLNRARTDAPGCLVLDVQLPDLSGLDLQRRMVDSNNEMPIVFITGHGDIPTTVRAMKAGAIEFLMKPFTDDDLLSAIRHALERSETVLAQERELQVLRTNYDSLSRRERQVMALVVSGRLNKQVAGELGIHEFTVKVHRGRVMRKMKANSLPDLVKMAMKLRLSSEPQGPQELSISAVR